MTALLKRIDRRKEWKAVRNKLDRVFSEFIRHRDTHPEAGLCITCGKLTGYTKLDCGHFIGRQHYGTRWEEKNSHGQCIPCNRFNEGRKDKYAEALKKKYGVGILDELELKKKLNAKKPDIFQMKALIEIFTQKTKELS